MNLLEQHGAKPQKEPRYTPIFIERSFTGLWTQRAALHDPSDLVTARFYGGRPDALIDGLNVELTNRLTLARRPGLTPFSTFSYPTKPLRAFEFRLTNGTMQILIDTAGAIYLDNQNGTATTILTKSAGSGQSFFVSVGNVCYIGDSVDLIKYTPLNPNGTTWNYSIAPPTSQPSVTVVPSGSSAVAWAASTVFSTMGLLVDPNGNAQQLFSVNALGNNSTQIGTSGNGEPAFNTTRSATTTDGTITWTSQGQIGLWTPNTVYLSGQAIFDPGSGTIYINSHNFSFTSGSMRPAFNGILGLGGARVSEPSGGGKWECLGKVSVAPTAVLVWTKNTAFNQYVQPSSGNDPTNQNCAIVFPLVPFISASGQLCNGQATFLLGATVSGTTANTNYTPWTGVASESIGQITQDNQLAWVCLGSATWTASTTYIAWQFGASTFSSIKDSNGNMQVCMTSGQSGASAPTWETSYGSTTADNQVVWVCVGPPVTWTANTKWYLPASGFVPPQPSQPYGGASVIGSSFVQFVTSSGLSGSSAPSWSVTIGGTTTDNTITWTCVAPVATNSISWTKGHVYAYSYKSRETNDAYVTAAPPGVAGPLGIPTGSETGGISTASPVYTITGADTGAVNFVSGIGSTDPQVDTIIIWRDADGGGADNMFELTEIAAPKPVAGVAQPWTFKDFLPDTPTSTFPGLNNLIPAPIDDENDPPPAGFLPMAYHFQRIWGVVGPNAFFSGGPDVITGNPNEAYNPADEFSFLSSISRLQHTPAGLIAFLSSDIEIIAGGPETASFYSTTLVPGIGLPSFNALDIYGGEMFFFSADSQLMVMSPSLQVSGAGFPIGDKLASFTAGAVYVAVHQAGIDNCVFVSDGSTQWYRLNPHQVPQNEPIWSPRAVITGGVGMVQSVEVSPGVHKLLVGGTGTNQNILERSLTTFSDNGTAYDAYFTMGSIVLAHPGQIAACKFIEADFAGVGSQPSMNVLLNEVSGSFTAMANKVSDPPQIYGPTNTPSSYFANRYYFAQNQTVARCRHLQLKVDYGSTDTVQNEIFDLTVNGRLYVER